MSKGLEALGRLQYSYVHVFKARENGKTQLVHDLNAIKKELKALEIIKEKRDDVLLSVIRVSKNAHDYNFRRGKNQLTQEEYDLLKEVLHE